MTAPAVETPRRYRWLLPSLWVVLTIALAIGLPRLPWQRAMQEAASMALPWVGAAILLNAAILPMWAVEWKLLVPAGVRVTFRRMFEIVALTASVLNSVPMLAGEISAVALLIGRAGLPRGAAVSVLAMDQLLVAFAKVTVLLLAVGLAPLPAWLREGLLSLSAVFAGALALLLVLAHRWEHFQQRLRSRTSRVRNAFSRAVAWGQHLEMLRDPWRAARAAALALAKKGAEVAAVVATQLAFGLDPSLSAAVLVVAALALSTLVPVAPANVGVYEATVFAVYRFLGVPAETALGLSLVQHLCFLVPSLGAGYVIATARQLVPRWRRAA